MGDGGLTPIRVRLAAGTNAAAAISGTLQRNLPEHIQSAFATVRSPLASLDLTSTRELTRNSRNPPISPSARRTIFPHIKSPLDQDFFELNRVDTRASLERALRCQHLPFGMPKSKLQAPCAPTPPPPCCVVALRVPLNSLEQPTARGSFSSARSRPRILLSSMGGHRDRACRAP